jgi:hypothetical protein
MATPQDQLYHLSYGISHIHQLLMPDNEDSMMDRLVSIEEEIQKIDRIQDQLVLIIKLLGKNG